MDWYVIIKWIWSIGALILFSALGLVLINASGLFNWKRSLTAELNALEAEPDEFEPRTRAIGIIEDRCSSVMQAISPEFTELSDMPDYVRSIAACYHPDEERPELRIAIGSLLTSLDTSLDRFDRILSRPGFSRFRTVTIRNIRQSRERYLKITSSRFYQWYLRHSRKIRAVSWLRYVMLIDPLSMLIFFSRYLTLLMFTKYVMVDLYLFFGTLALDAYDPRKAPDEPEPDIEETLDELDEIQAEDEAMFITDPEIKRIRGKLTGVKALAFSNPSFPDWRDAVCEAARHIAETWFPESEHPLEEAAIGPLLERTRAWIATISRGETYPVMNRFYHMRVSTIVRMKDLSDLILPKTVRKYIGMALNTYDWVKWPIKVYQWTKRISPWQIAMEVGWAATKKTTVVYVCNKTFDTACRELEGVYRQSRDMKA